MCKWMVKSVAQHEPDPAEAQRTVLAEHYSIPLGDAVKLVNKISQNLHAEVLLRTAARQQGRWNDPEDLQKFPEEFYAKAGIARGRCGADGWIGIVATRSGDAAGLCGAVAICAEAKVVSRRITRRCQWRVWMER